MEAIPKYEKDQEIDLNYISNRIKRFIERMAVSFYRYLMMLYRNKWIVLLLLIIGVGYGYYKEHNTPALYKHEIMVAPNFKSVDYLYKRVELFNSVNSSTETCTISRLKIEPITDIFTLITQKREYMDAFRVFTDKVDFEKIIKETVTSKNYRYHLLTVYTAGEDKDGKTVQRFLDDLNSDPYYIERQKFEKVNTIHKKEELEKSVAQINLMMESLGNNKPLNSSNEVNMNTYTNLDDILLLKERFLEEMNRLQVEMIEQQKTIFDVSRQTNIVVTKSILTNKMIVMPILLILIFSIIVWGIRIFKKLEQLAASK